MTFYPPEVDTYVQGKSGRELRTQECTCNSGSIQDWGAHHGEPPPTRAKGDGSTTRLRRGVQDRGTKEKQIYHTHLRDVQVKAGSQGGDGLM